MYQGKQSRSIYMYQGNNQEVSTCIKGNNQEVSTCIKEGIVKKYLHVSRKDNQEVPT